MAGGVRDYFRDRRAQLTKSNSANSAAYTLKKRQGYDKSRPLEPLNRNASETDMAFRSTASDVVSIEELPATFHNLSRLRVVLFYRFTIIHCYYLNFFCVDPDLDLDALLYLF